MSASTSSAQETLAYRQVSPVPTIVRGLVKHCPRCGQGKLFKRWFNMAERCPRCDLKFEREEGFFLGAYTMNLAFMMIAAVLVIVVGFAIRPPDGSIVPMVMAGMACTVLLPPLLYPFSKTLWVAVDQLMRRGLGEQFSGADGGRHPR